MAELGAVDGAGLQRGLVLAPTAQLAGDHPGWVDVHALADERGAVAACAALGPGEALVQAPAQQRQLQLEHVLQGRRHAGDVRPRTPASFPYHGSRGQRLFDRNIGLPAWTKYRYPVL